MKYIIPLVKYTWLANKNVSFAKEAEVNDPLKSFPFKETTLSPPV